MSDHVTFATIAAKGQLCMLKQPHWQAITPEERDC
jgi:hypothetical protein